MSRFAEPQDPVFRALNSSIGFDWRLAPYDIAQSRAHAKMLAAAGIIDGSRQGREQVWTLNPGRLADGKRHLETIAAGWDDALARFKLLAEE